MESSWRHICRSAKNNCWMLNPKWYRSSQAFYRHHANQQSVRYWTILRWSPGAPPKFSFPPRTPIEHRHELPEKFVIGLNWQTRYKSADLVDLVPAAARIMAEGVRWNRLFFCCYTHNLTEGRNPPRCSNEFTVNFCNSSSNYCTFLIYTFTAVSGPIAELIINTLIWAPYWNSSFCQIVCASIY